MKVKDLIAELSLIDPEYEVRIGHESGVEPIDESETDYTSQIVILWTKV